MGSPSDTDDLGRADDTARLDATDDRDDAGRGGSAGGRPAWLVPVLLVVAGVVVLLVGLTIWLYATDGDTVLDGVAVAGEPVGGLDREQLERAVGALATDRALLPVTVTIAASDAAEDTTAEDAPDDGAAEDAGSDDAVDVADLPGTTQVAADRVTAGVDVHGDEAVDRAWSFGRRGPILGTVDRFRARTGAAFEVPLEESVDEDRVDAFAADVAEELSLRSQDGWVDLVLEGDQPTVEVTDAVAGRTVVADDVRAAVRDDLRAAEPVDVEVAAEPVVPAITQPDVDAIADDARAVVSGPIAFTNATPADDLELDEVQLASLIQVASDPDAAEGERLRLVLTGDRVRDLLGADTLASLEVEPVDASFEVTGIDLEVTGGTDGFAVDEDGLADAILALATTADAEARSAELPGETASPEVTLDDLGVREEVASFTTALTAGEPRNVNIQRAAELFAGTVVAPGERMSLNDTLGPRTRDRGFQENGYIDRGEIISVVGGGVSQFATTTMNAAWFAGLRLVQFQPHSFYFTRYPMGREATVSFGTVDLVVENDTPYTLAFGATASESEVTVVVFSTPWAEVDTWTGEPYDTVEGEVRDGFTIDFGRTITTPDGSRSEDYTHRYNPEDLPDDDEDDA